MKFRLASLLSALVFFGCKPPTPVAAPEPTPLPAPISATGPESTPAPAAIQTPAPTPTPRRAPEGIVYLTKRVSIATDTGISAFAEGSEVQVKSASADGTLHVEARGTSFDVPLKDTTNDLDKRDAIVATREKINTTATVAIAVKATNSQQRVDDNRASNRGEILANKKKSIETAIAAAQAEKDKLQSEFDDSVRKYTEQHTWNGRFHRNVGNSISGAAPADSPNNVARKNRVAELDAFIRASREQINNLK